MKIACKKVAIYIILTISKTSVRVVSVLMLGAIEGTCSTENQVLFNDLWIQIIFSLLYILIFVIGVTGNTLVCLAVIRNPQVIP